MSEIKSLSRRAASLRATLCAITAGAMLVGLVPAGALASPRLAETGAGTGEHFVEVEDGADAGAANPDEGAEGTEQIAADDTSEAPAAEDPTNGSAGDAAEETTAPEPGDAEPGAAPSTVAVSGSLLVLPLEAEPISIEAGEELPAPEIAHPGSVSLVTDDDTVIELFEGDTHDYVTGQQAEAILAVPEPVQQQVEQQLETQEIEPTTAPLGDAELVELVIETAEQLETPLELLEHETVPLAATNSATAAAGVAHTVDVIFLGGSKADLATESDIREAIKRMSGFWSSETGGRLSGVAVNQVQRAIMPELCGKTMDIWGWAATRFGRSLDSYLQTPGRHLVVIESSSACGQAAGNGLGSVGAGVQSGGVTWGTVDRSKPGTWNGVMFHEFGHNLSLQHSNELHCSAGHWDTPGFTSGSGWPASPKPSNSACSIAEYYDWVDVMGMGMTFTNSVTKQSASNAEHVAALNTTHRIALGALPASAIKRVSSSQTVELRPSTDPSGVRAIEATIPGTSQKYLIEYRAGKGRDANSIYAKWSSVSGTKELAPGVRVLRAPGDKSSVALYRPKISGEANDRLPYLVPGSSFTASGSKLTIKVTSASSTSAKVQFSFAGSTPPASDPPATKPPATYKLPLAERKFDGKNRFDTAAKVSKANFSAKGGTVIVATGLDYPDSLSAAPLGAKLNAPLLLTKPSALPAETASEIKRLAPKRILVIGGTGAVSGGVQTKLRELAPKAEIKRLSGSNRYATSLAIAKEGWGKSGAQTAFIATGTGFADALSAGAAAGSIGAPVILVPGHNAGDAGVSKLLRQFGTKTVHIAGGPGAVSAKMEQSLRGKLGGQRFWGQSRYDTSAAVAAKFNTTGGSVYLANGLGFADALAGAVVAGRQQAPLMLAQQGCVPKPINAAQLNSIKPTRIQLLGGSGALSNAVKSNTVCKK